MERLRESAAAVQCWIAGERGDPFNLLRKMKFEQIGRHPVEDRSLNLFEQVNQTWTYAVALAAASKLIELHPDAGGFYVAPGAHMSIPLDIMSRREGLVGAETFAAVDPRNNRKLVRDIEKMARRQEQHRYVFFCSPKFQKFERHPRFEVNSVQVWSVDI
jgi:hypothetical protein